MTPAEFKSTRELLGLSAQWLASRLRVHIRTIQKFEDGALAVPEGITAELFEISESIAAAVDNYIAFFADNADAVLQVPRRESDTEGELPASAHRAIAARVRLALPALRLEYI